MISSMAEIKIFKSQRGKNKIAYRGFTYTKNRNNVTTTSWICDVRGCRGSLSTAIGTSANPVEGREHNHVPDPARVAAALAVSQMKEDATQSDQPPRRVASETFDGLNDETISKMPSKQNLRRIVQRKRTRDEAFPALPQEVRFQIPDEYRFVQINDVDHRFLLFDTMQNDVEDGEDPEAIEDRIIAFSTDEMLRLLQENRHWMADGTFKVVPNLFYQLFTVHAILDDGRTVIPAVYCLMTSKRQDMYAVLWNRLKESAQLNPASCVMDFEAAAHAALRTAFPNVEIQGCFFHLSQNIWRKIQELGLRQAYIDQREVRLHCKMLAALAFMLSGQVQHGFDMLEESREEENLDNLSPLFEFFEDNYIGRYGRGGRRRRPRFSTETWNVRTRCVDGLPRTNNKIEGWHRALQQQFSGDHPSIWRFFRGIKKEQALQHATLVQYRAGQPCAPERKEYQRVNRNIRNIINRNVQDEIEFLRAIAGNLNLNV